MIEKMILEQVEILRDHLMRGEVTPEFVRNRAQMIYTLSLSVESGEDRLPISARDTARDCCLLD